MIKNFKIGDRARAEFEFYRTTTLDMIGICLVDSTESSPNGSSALEAWYQKDTHGQTVACREMDVLQKVLRGKASWNLQVKLWAEDIADGMLLTQPELVEYCHECPEWVFRAVMEQAGKLAQQLHRFLPRFARAEFCKGHLWFPHMDEFDPCI